MYFATSGAYIDWHAYTYVHAFTWKDGNICQVEYLGPQEKKMACDTANAYATRYGFRQ